MDSPVRSGARSRPRGLWTGLATVLVATVTGLRAPFPALAETPPSAMGSVVSFQNRVETKKSAAPDWTPSVKDQPLFERDRLRTGPGSRAAILYQDETLQRLNENSEVEVRPPSAGNPGLLRVIAGEHYFSSRSPRIFKQIGTPVVTAAIEGTEFVVAVAGDTTTTITMLEGTVSASNAFGSLVVGRGEQAFVEPGKAPVKRILVRPRDAVAWALYYPPVIGGRDAARLGSLGESGRDMTQAADRLASGQVAAAKNLIDAVRTKRPDDPFALALASVIEVASNRKVEALQLAERAVAADPLSCAAALALSFAAQANFDIPRARALSEKAAELDPENPHALSRVAELRSSEGNLPGAMDAARQAVARDPAHPRALTVLGFADLAELRSADAEKDFERAVAADPSFALARLGLGIARIRRGRVSEGRREIQTATVLDPDDAIFRSYLAKAYYEEKRPVEAGKELATAKELDPSDPTPYLYDAIRMQDENRPIEALQELRASIERNDYRAVYRSRLLLDQDRAVRASDLARVYNDLGFEQLGLVTARRSADQDHANYSSHLFLAGNYRNLAGFAPAFLSEVLQARIYQPVSVNAVRPDVVNESVSFNEYTALFDRPRVRAFGGLSYGRTDPRLDKIFVNEDALLDQVGLDRSAISGRRLAGTWNTDRFAGALSYDRLSDDGFRTNADQRRANYRGFFELAPTSRDTFQANLLYGLRVTGDLPIRQNVSQVTKERFQTELRNAGFGYHHIFSPSSDLAVSAIYNRTEEVRASLDPAFPGKTTGILEGPQLEVQQILRFPRVTGILGVGGFHGEVRLEGPGTSLRGDDSFVNGYAYAKFHHLGVFEATVGAAVERVVSPSGFFTPRDAQIGAARIEFSRTTVSPKLGVALYLPTKTTLRAAGYDRLSPALGRIQTLEPTQVAGFNQVFSDPGGTRTRSYGAGLDQEVTHRLFLGASILRRSLTIQEPYCTTGDPFSGCAFQTATYLAVRHSDERTISAYLNATLGKYLAASVDYTDGHRKFDFTMVDLNGLFEDRIEIRRFQPQVRLFLPCGFFAIARATYNDQSIFKRDDLSSDRRTLERARFWITDLQLGYRLPGRYGSFLLDAKNLSDREFVSFDQPVETQIAPARSVTLTVNFAF